MTPELPLEVMCEDTRERCRAALDSDLLRAVARVAGGETGLVELVKRTGPLPAAWMAIAQRAEAENIPDAALNVARYLMLGRILAFSLDRVATLPVPRDVRHFLYDEFRFVAEPERNSLDCFEAGSYALAGLCREVCLDRFPAGQLHFEESGFPRSWFGRIPAWQVLPMAWHIFGRMGGRRPYYMPHNAPRRKFSVLFREKEQRRSMVRIAQMLELNPHVHGFIGEGWLHSPNLGEASPHLKWMMEINRELVALGAAYATLGRPPEDSGFLVGDKKRISLYRSGQWAPLTGVLVAPRESMLEWARRQVL